MNKTHTSVTMVSTHYEMDMVNHRVDTATEISAFEYPVYDMDVDVLKQAFAALLPDKAFTASKSVVLRTKRYKTVAIAIKYDVMTFTFDISYVNKPQRNIALHLTVPTLHDYNEVVGDIISFIQLSNLHAHDLELDVTPKFLSDWNRVTSKIYQREDGGTSIIEDRVDQKWIQQMMFGIMENYKNTFVETTFHLSKMILYRKQGKVVRIEKEKTDHLIIPDITVQDASVNNPEHTMILLHGESQVEHTITYRLIPSAFNAPKRFAEEWVRLIEDVRSCTGHIDENIIDDYKSGPIHVISVSSRNM